MKKKKNEKKKLKKRRSVGFEPTAFVDFPFTRYPVPPCTPSLPRPGSKPVLHWPKQGIIPTDPRLKETRHVGDWRVKYNKLKIIS